MLVDTHVLRNGTKPPSQRPGAERKAPLPPVKRGYSLNDARRDTPPVVMPSPTMLIGMGTTGSKITHGAASLIISAAGSSDRPRRPKHFDHLLIDSAAAKPNWNPDRFHRLIGGIDGAGTRSQEGEELILDPANFDPLFKRLISTIERLEADPLIPWSYTTRERVNFFLVGGFGGTSGGVQQVMIDMIHAAAQHCRIDSALVYLLLIGPEMPTTDPHNAIDALQARVICANAAGNLARIEADFTSSDVQTVVLPNGRKISIRRCDRVWAPILVDRGNGRVHCRSTDDLVALQARALFHYMATQGGQHAAEQNINHNKLGGPQRGRYSSETYS